MRVILEIISEQDAGRRAWLQAGQVLEIGRTERADFVVQHDRRMSGVHFRLACDDRTCRVRDLGSSNGTLLNGDRVQEAEVRDGDEIAAGRTKFAVHIEDVAAPAPQAGPVSTSEAKSQPNSSSLVGSTPSRSDGLSAYEAAMKDEDPGVRREALLAAGWTRQRWLLDYCRRVSTDPTPEQWDAILLLAILGKPSDLERVLAVSKATPLGPRRFQALGAFGHPAVIEPLLEELQSEDPRSVVAAAAAFTKITGADIESDQPTQLPPEDGSEPDEFEQEFLDEVMLPSLKLATDHWDKVKTDFAKGTRWCRGFDLSQGAIPEVLAQLDLESRWEACLRGKFEGTWQGSSIDLEMFPQK